MSGKTCIARVDVFCAEMHFSYLMVVLSSRLYWNSEVKFLLKRLIIFLIKCYRWGISPVLGANCRHTPTCSAYALASIEEWGLKKGLWLSIKRIVRCHPWGTSGYDPVPKCPDVKSMKTGSHTSK